MFLYLTSSASQTLDKLVPYLPKKPGEMSVAFIPTAANIYGERPWAERDRAKLVELGFHVEDLDIAGKTSEQIKNALSNKEIIFVGGGSTSYLLEQAQLSGFLEIAKDLVRSGVIYIGSSAGSLFAGPNIELDQIYDEGDFGKTLDSYDALGLVSFIVLPHADNPDYSALQEKVFEKYKMKYDLGKLQDNQAYLVRDKKITLIES